ncbi:hypothetical protein C923_01219 [Plasmodium falciparum UGT5.1]|uniref:G10 protein n=1 Tax=Plasmodium falciparum UGT5.1 TaxID=1237627 RepID=W7JGB8_PLAFA|nr:hypothetical protein C923_01219 [Plasmodium falciparum UGT5.1]
MKFNEIMKNEETILLRKKDIFNNLKKNEYYNTKKLYDYLVQEKYVDGALISKWRKQGYENLCCLKCIQVSDSNFSNTCICRVPKSDLGNKFALYMFIYC